MFKYFQFLAIHTVPDANLAVPTSPPGIPSVTPSGVTSAKLSSSKAESEKDACEASLSAVEKLEPLREYQVARSDY